MNRSAQASLADALTKLLPFLAWLPRITRQSLRADLVAGITVALVAIPQSLAYAQLAGVPAYYGLYASLLPVIVGALMGSSPALSTGPVAMTSLLTAASVMTLASYGTEQFYTYVILMALISGLFQMGLGIARMGILINFLSYPVLRGFINAAAIIIGLSQLPSMLGIKLKNSTHFMSDVLHVIENAGQAHWPSLAFGAGALAALLLIKHFFPRLPGVLIVVALATWISYLTGFEQGGGKVIGVIPQGIPSLSMPELDWNASIHMLPSAFVIALISFMEAMSSSKIIAIKTRTQWDENQELIGQGIAKIVAAFSHSMPVSGSFSRSALNLASGARTGLASVISALMVLLTLLYFTPLLHHLPKPVLAAVIMTAVMGLVSVQTIKDAWCANRWDGIAAVITFGATLAFAPNIQNGILTGIILSLVLFLLRTMKPTIVLLGSGEESEELEGVRHFNLPKLHPQIAALRFDGQLYFANVSYFEESVLHLISNHPELRYILVVGSGINGLDASGVEMLRNLLDRLGKGDTQLVFCNLKSKVTQVMKNTGLMNQVGEQNIFGTMRFAISELQERLEGTPTTGQKPPEDNEPPKSGPLPTIPV